MALSTRTRFLAISVTITVIGLLTFTHVIYDKAIGYKHSIETKSFRTLSEQLITLYKTTPPLEDFKQLLQGQIIAENQPAQIFAIKKVADVTDVFHKKTFKPELILGRLIQQANQNPELNESLIEIDNAIYYWVKRTLPGEDNNATLISVYPLSGTAIAETFRFFGTPLFISGILLLWCMVWASIILSSLVTKLQNQKQILADQAADIEESHDAALAANQAKSSFLANMSHEIRTPLTSIIGFAESCLDANQSMSERYDATSTIIRSGNHLLHIINEILDISKIEAGKLDIEIRPVKLSELLHEVNMFVKVLAQEKGLTFGINYSFPLPKTIHTDQLRLKQILLNLCSNAIKFTEKGHVFLNVSYLPQTEHLKLEVVDTGIGMTTEQMEKIFAPFQQADSSITREFGGTGLGLTLSKQLTEILDGELTVESTPGKGSHFITFFKLNEIDTNELDYENDYQAAFQEPVPVSKTIPSVSGKLLIAEDNPDIQALVKMLINKIGADTTIVENGKLAVEEALTEDFDLIFLDIQMPVMDGFEALKQLRENNYKKPVFAMTANTMKKDQDKCFTAGFDGFISKPIDKNDLYSVIIDYLKAVEESTTQPSFITSDILLNEPQIIDLVDAFLERIPEIMDVINQAYTEKDWEEIAEQIHQMKGIGGAFGYSIITKISEKIEFALTAQDTDQIKLLIDDLNTVCRQAIAGKEENHKIVG